MNKVKSIVLGFATIILLMILIDINRSGYFVNYRIQVFRKRSLKR